MSKRKRKTRSKTGLPQGSYPLPDGRVVLPATVGPADKRGRRISVRGVLNPPEVMVPKLARLLLEIATNHPELLDEFEARKRKK